MLYLPLFLAVAAFSSPPLAAQELRVDEGPGADAAVDLIDSQVLGAENFEALAELIRPSDDERKFEDVGWRNEFWPAVLEARELGRPVLLWTMNGHPLGCT
ncbi:MAG: hypothetical protein ACI8Q9_001826 [Planctomycetota bacterium]|jgi:hypothetical protein